jgi:glycosyltransferase involved in cell wall biosynthesis
MPEIIKNNEKNILEARMQVNLSVIIPITERHDDIEEIYYAYRHAIKNDKFTNEVIFVIDGYFREAFTKLKSLKEKGEQFTIIKHTRSFGEAAAISEGFKFSKGDTIMTLPAYHQVEPQEISRLIESLNEYDMVIVRRWPRKDSTFNRMQTKIFHFLINTITGINVRDIGCSIRLMKRRVLEEINVYGDLHRFLPVLAHKQGFKIREIDLNQSQKEKKVRTYPFGIYIRRLIDLLTVFFLVKFTKKPLRFFGLTGFAILLPGIFINLYLIVGRLFQKFSLSDRPLFLISILLIVLGIQMFAIGLIGEIIIFTHASEIKEYKIEEIIN